MASLIQAYFESDNNIDESEPFDDRHRSKIFRPTADVIHISGWNPINRISETSVGDWAYREPDPEYGLHNALDEEPVHPSLEEKYLDHYGCLNYINSMHKEKLADEERAEQSNNVWGQDPVARKHGTPIKRPWDVEEDAWLDLFHEKIRGAIEAGAVIKIPGRGPVLEAFNAFFKRKRLEEGDEPAAAAAAGESEWTPRTIGSMHRKLRFGGSKVGEERKRLSALLANRKNARTYVPKLSVEEVLEYQRHGTVVVDDMRAKGFQYCMVETLREASREIRKRKFGK